MYGSASELRAMLEYDFSQEREFSYYRFKKEQNKIYQSIPIFWDKRCGKQTLMPIFFFCKFFDLKGMIKDLWK